MMASNDTADAPTAPLEVAARGTELLNSPLLNKGTCFTAEERELFGLQGLLPSAVSSPEEQLQRVYGNYQMAPNDIQRYLFLAALHDRNETLFYSLLGRHIEEMAPIVYTPTVGAVCATYSRLYRRPRGLYVSADDRGRIEEVLRRAPVRDCRVIVLTDNEAILGLGDLGVGGMGIPVGKLTLYTAGAGLHPTTCLPLDLDVGTNNRELLEDPLYLGLRRERLRGEPYTSLLDELVEAIRVVFPHAVVQWEDFANENAFQVLERFRDRVPSFNDDIQGTGAVVVAGLRTALHQAGRPLRDERIVFFGAGASGGGCALAARQALRAAGVPAEQARRRVLCLDSKGLILSDRPGLDGHKSLLAVDPSVVEGWSGATNGTFGLEAVVRNFRPTALVGASGRPGAFTEELIRTMHASCPRPIVFPLSNPTSRSEASPSDVLRWTDGAALVAAGSPNPPVEVNGVSYEIGQANNVLIFPGLGLGAVAVGARRIDSAAFLAAADALFDAARSFQRPGAPLFPPIRDLRRISRAVASAVARALVDSGATPPMEPEEIERRIDAWVWRPEYRPYVPAHA